MQSFIRPLAALVVLAGAFGSIGLAAPPAGASATTTSTQSRANDPAAAAEANLAPKLEKDHGAKYRLNLSSRQVLSILGQTEETGASMQADISVVIDEAAPKPTDNGVKATLVFDRIAVQFEGGQALTGSFDSATPADQDAADDPLAMTVRPIVGQPIRLTLEADGTIGAVGGLDDVAPDDPRAAFLFDQLFSETALASMAQPIFRVRPAGEDEPLNLDRALNRADLAEPVGGTWTINAEPVDSLGMPAAELTLTLDAAARGDDGDRLATISIDGTPRADAPERLQMLDPKVAERSVTGEIVWNETDGLLQSLQTTSKTTMTAESQFSISIDIDANTSLRRID